MKEKLKTLAHLATPVEGRPGLGKALLAGGSAIAIVCAGAAALTAAAVMLAAIFVIYLIATRVLGLKLEFDPKAFYDKYAHAESDL
jgi:hypothetical protein